MRERDNNATRQKKDNSKMNIDQKLEDIWKMSDDDIDEIMYDADYDEEEKAISFFRKAGKLAADLNVKYSTLNKTAKVLRDKLRLIQKARPHFCKLSRKIAKADEKQYRVKAYLNEGYCATSNFNDEAECDFQYFSESVFSTESKAMNQFLAFGLKEAIQSAADIWPSLYADEYLDSLYNISAGISAKVSPYYWFKPTTVENF